MDFTHFFPFFRSKTCMICCGVCGWRRRNDKERLPGVVSNITLEIKEKSQTQVFNGEKKLLQTTDSSMTVRAAAAEDINLPTFKKHVRGEDIAQWMCHLTFQKYYLSFVQISNGNPTAVALFPVKFVLTNIKKKCNLKEKIK